MVIVMLLGIFNALIAALFVTLNSAAPQLRALTFETDEPDTCLENNRNFINQICTYPGQREPCLHESFGVNGTITHVYDIGRLAELLCNQSLDQSQIYEQYCCHTRKCRFWCYGKKTRDRRSSATKHLYT